MLHFIRRSRYQIRTNQTYQQACRARWVSARCRLAVAGCAAVLLLLSASAQVATTIFARKLHIQTPAEFSAGGVAWTKSSIGLPTSWSAEGNGIRVEVARETVLGSEEEQKARLLQVLPNANLRPVSVSGFAGWEGETDQAAILGVSSKTGFWIVLARGANAMAFTRTVTLDRDTPAGWMPRVLPGGISAVLPYHLTQRRNAPNYELQFNEFSIDYRIDTASQDKRLDVKSSVDTVVQQFKANKAYTDQKVERKRVRDFTSAELVIKRYKENGRERQEILIVGLIGQSGFQLSWKFDPQRKDHREYSNRILNTIKQTKDPFIPGQRVEFGETGLSIETQARMKPLEEKSGVQEWLGETGGAVVMARFVPTSIGSDTVDVSVAANVFPSVVKSQMGELNGFKTETVPTVVSGINGLLVKTEWKNGYRQGLFVGTMKGIYAVDVTGISKQEVEQVIRSAQITMARQVDPLKQYQFEGSRLVVLSLPDASRQVDRGDKNFESVEVIQVASPGEGAFTSVLQKLKDRGDEVADLPAMTNNFLKEVASSAKGKLKILNQDWGSDSLGALYWAAYTIEINGATLEGYITTVASEGDVLLQNAFYMSKDSNVRGVGQIMMNSYRLTMLSP